MPYAHQPIHLNKVTAYVSHSETNATRLLLSMLLGDTPSRHSSKVNESIFKDRRIVAKQKAGLNTRLRASYKR